MQVEMMGPVLLVFLIGALNLGLGYALAVCLGFGLPTSADAWGLPDAMQLEPAYEPQQTASLSDMPAAMAEASDPVANPNEQPIETLRAFVVKSISSLTEYMARLKKGNRGDPQRTAWTFVADLQAVCQPYLEKLKLVADGLSDDVGDELQALVLDQAAQLETTLSNLNYMNFDSGISEAMGRLSQDAENSLAMARKLQTAIDASRGTPDQTTS